MKANQIRLYLNFLLFIVIPVGITIYLLLVFLNNIYQQIFGFVFLIILQLFPIKEILKKKKDNYFRPFSNWSFKIISNLFFDYKFEENEVFMATKSKSLLIPRLISNIIDINQFKVDFEKKKWKIVKIFPKFRILKYQFWKYSFYHYKDSAIHFKIQQFSL